MFDGKFRKGVDGLTAPVGRGLAAIGLTANALTGFGLVSSGASAIAIGTGWLGIGTALLVVTALADLFDGPVATAQQSSSSRGAFFDSTADRVADGLLLGGIAWYLAGEHGGRWAVLPMAVLGVSALVSYERAKAELLGFEAKGGLMERAERTVVLAVAVAFEVLLVPLLWLLLALTSLTAVMRFAKVWHQASAHISR
ncbi:CDP-alcohol phosphatidyltransferase family protein [Candidatus Poriferisodalis sp.]|uniref:CDP-alcohol phosphatidyltransferase family protein n=1 Tax=Candidatus Poriferisodalis sp. TaxID=3101277 RepID=UPI003B026B4B